MKKSNILISACFAIAICISLICGTTYALFTSESNVDVAITSGKVNVTATIDKSSVQTKDLNSDYALGLDHTFGKDIDLTEDEVSLNNIVCGDGIKFNIVITNHSTVAVKYRTVISAVEDNGVFNALTVEIGEGVIYDGNQIYSTWKPMSVEKETTTIVIEMPDVDNDYQGKNCRFVFTVEAIQANAATTDGMAHIGEGEERKDFLTLQSAIDEASNGATIYLDEDVTILSKVRILKPIVLDGNGHKLTFKDTSVNVGNEVGACIYAKSSGVEFKNMYLDCYSAENGGLTMDGAYMYTLTDMVFTGEVRHSLVRFINSSGGIMTNCTVTNSMAPEKTMYYQYGMPVATGIFVNRNTKLAGQTEEGGVRLELNNCQVDSLLVNGSNSTFELPKTYVNTGTHIDFVFYSSSEIPASKAIVFDGGEAERVFAPQAFSVNVGLYRDMKYLDAEVYAITNAQGLALFGQWVNEGTYNHIMNKKNIEVYLDADIDLDGIDWKPIGTNADSANKFFGTFDGNHHTISNLTVDTTKVVEYQATGLFGALGGTLKNLTITNAKVNGLSKPNSVGNTNNGIAIAAGSIYPSGAIENVTVLDSSVSGNRYVAGIAGYVYGNVNNCTVERTNITANPDTLSGSYDNGDKVGGIVGYLNDDQHTLNGNTVKDCTISAWRDLGGIGGCVGVGIHAEFKNNKVSGNTLLFVENPEYTKEHSNMGDLIGRNTGNPMDDSNIIE